MGEDLTGGRARFSGLKIVVATVAALASGTVIAAMIDRPARAGAALELRCSGDEVTVEGSIRLDKTRRERTWRVDVVARSGRQSRPVRGRTSASTAAGDRRLRFSIALDREGLLGSRHRVARTECSRCRTGEGRMLRIDVRAKELSGPGSDALRRSATRKLRCSGPPVPGGTKPGSPEGSDRRSPGTGDGERSGPTSPHDPGAISSECLSADRFAAGRVVGHLGSGSINEASGLAASRRTEGVLWIHNDSGDAPRVFAVDESGALRTAFTLTGAAANDWEDIAMGPGDRPGVPYLYVGDIGDNAGVRQHIVIYRMAEPTVDVGYSAPQTVGDVEAVRARYPDGPRDAEAMVVDPAQGDVYVISKREWPSKVYRLPSRAWSQDDTASLELVGELAFGGVVAADQSADGRAVLIKTYAGVNLYVRPAGAAHGFREVFGATAQPLPYILEPQGEAVAFDSRSRGYFTVSEGIGRPINYFECLEAPG